MYRHVLERMVMAHFNNKLIAYVNTGIDPGMAGQTRSAIQLRALQNAFRCRDVRLQLRVNALAGLSPTA